MFIRTQNKLLVCLIGFMYVPLVMAGQSVSLVHSSQSIYLNNIGTTGITLDKPGYYTLGEDIAYNGNASSTAITIASSGVTLDLNNRFIEQSSTNTGVSGIEISPDVHDIVIKNGTLSGFTENGLFSDSSMTGSGAYNIKVENLDITGVFGGAIALLGGSNVGADIHDWVFSNCTITECSSFYVIYIVYCNSVSINNCKMNNHECFYNCQCDDSTNVVFNNCDLCKNTLISAIRCTRCVGCIIDGCVINNNNRTGNMECVGILYSDGCVVRNCMISNIQSETNTCRGIYLYQGSENNVDSCVLTSIAGVNAYGIDYSSTGSEGVIQNCNITDVVGTNKGIGIYVRTNASKTLLTGNKVYSCSTSGIRNNSLTSLIYNCEAGANGDATNPSNFTGDNPAKTTESTGNIARGQYGDGLDYQGGKVYIHASAIQKATPGLTISLPGYYVLAEDVDFVPTATGYAAITIDSSYVTLNMNGKAIYQGNSTANVDGIEISTGVHDLEIKNGTLSGFSQYGFVNDASSSGNGAYNVTVENLDITGMPTGSGSIGINLTSRNASGADIHDWVFSDCTITDNVVDDMAKMDYCNNITMKNCKANGNSCSFHVCDCSNSSKIVLNNCDFCKNIGLIVRLLNCSGCVIDGCVLMNNNAQGISSLRCINLDTSNGCVVQNCMISKNQAGGNQCRGIILDGGSGNKVDSCSLISLSGTIAYGIGCFSTESESVIQNCNVTDIAGTTGNGYGIYVESNASKIVLMENKAYSNSTTGIYNDSSTSLIYDCKAGANGTATAPSNYAGSYPAKTTESTGNSAQGQYGDGLDYQDGKVYIHASAIQKATPGLTISSPGYYVLAEDVDYSPGSAAPAITIDSSYVTLDMNGKAIYQTNATANVNGINVNTDIHDIVIKNGTLSGFTQYGLLNDASSSGEGAYNVTIENLDITGMPTGATNAIRLDSRQLTDQDIHDWTFLNCTITENSVPVAVYMDNSSNILMKNCKFNNNQVETAVLYAFRCYVIRLKDCEFCNNLGSDILRVINMDGRGRSWIIDGCVINYNIGALAIDGIRFDTSFGSIIRNSVISYNIGQASENNPSVGIRLINGEGNLVEKTEVSYLNAIATIDWPLDAMGIVMNDNSGTVVSNCLVSAISANGNASINTPTATGIYINGYNQFVENTEVVRTYATNSGTGSTKGRGVYFVGGSQNNIVYKCKSISNLNSGFNDGTGGLPGTGNNAVTGCVAALNATNYAGSLAAGVTVPKQGGAVALTIYDADNRSIQ